MEIAPPGFQRLRKKSPATASTAPAQTFHPTRWPTNIPRNGTMITYSDVMKPALLTLVSCIPTCCVVLATAIARPASSPPRIESRRARAEAMRRQRQSATGSRMSAPAAKRTPVKRSGPMCAVASFCATNVDPQIRAVVSSSTSAAAVPRRRGGGTTGDSAAGAAPDVTSVAPASAPGATRPCVRRRRPRRSPAPP
jgi:hypothetical protein